uniref:Uncharacterized protein n=1 Tax=Utricularia reniformis TaxID=192314 RepID=A0A1Y0B0K3_9LAMI|nr:hypothetical protein AEK19_MT0719 [Utricularia reniformis]ART30965.1 hypothetical protein AEK19_MT0719 [Utricularia reniformis]
MTRALTPNVSLVMDLTQHKQDFLVGKIHKCIFG